MYDKNTDDSGGNGAQGRPGHKEEIRKEALRGAGENGGEEEMEEEKYFDKETGYWVGTGNFRKRKVEDPDSAYDNAHN